MFPVGVLVGAMTRGDRMKRIARVVVGCTLSTALGCAAAQTGPSPRGPLPRRPPAAVTTTVAELQPTVPPSPALLSTDPPLLKDAPRAPRHVVETVPLPKRTVGLVALGENNGRMYAVSSDNEVLEIARGAGAPQVKSLKGPVCKEPFFMGQTREPELTAFHFDGEQIQLWGSITRAGRGNWEEPYGVTRAANGRWSCATKAPAQIVSVSVHGGAYVYHAMHGMFGLLDSLAGLPALPGYDPVPTFYASNPSSIWAIQSEPGVPGVTAYQYNGAHWQSRQAPALDAATALYEASDGTVWVLGTDEKKRTRVMRFDGKSWTDLALPADFSAALIAGTAPSNLWFIGKKTWYAVEEGQLAAMPAPFLASAVWADQAGDIWVAGRQDEPNKDDEETTGSLARILGAATSKDNADSTVGTR